MNENFKVDPSNIIIGLANEDEVKSIDLRNTSGWLIAGDAYHDRSLGLQAILDQLLELEEVNIIVIASRGGKYWGVDGFWNAYADKVDFYIEDIFDRDNFIATYEQLEKVRELLGDDTFRVVIIEDANLLFEQAARYEDSDIFEEMVKTVEMIARKARPHGALIITSEHYNDSSVPNRIQDNCDGRISFAIREEEDRNHFYPEVIFDGSIPDPWLIYAADLSTAVVGYYNDPGVYVDVATNALDSIEIFDINE